MNSFNPFTPETLQSLNLDTSIVANRGFSQKSVTERQTVSWLIMSLLQDLHCLHRNLFLCTGLKE